LEIVGENTLSSDEADTLIMAARSLFIDFGDTNNDGDDNEDSVQTTQITDEEEK
jgi:hypothetical protein